MFIKRTFFFSSFVLSFDSGLMAYNTCCSWVPRLSVSGYALDWCPVSVWCRRKLVWGFWSMCLPLQSPWLQCWDRKLPLVNVVLYDGVGFWNDLWWWWFDVFVLIDEDTLLILLGYGFVCGGRIGVWWRLGLSYACCAWVTFVMFVNVFCYGSLMVLMGR